MTERVAAECRRPVACMLEQLLSLAAECLYLLEGGVQVVHMNRY
jgi:hypothetical protein